MSRERSAQDLYRDMHGAYPDTSSSEFRNFCLALYIASRRRHSGASPEQVERIKKKHASVLLVIEEIRKHAAMQKQSGGSYQGRLEKGKKIKNY